MDALTEFSLLRLLAASGLLADAPGFADALFDILVKRGLVAGPVIAVDSRVSALGRRLLAVADGERRVFLFPPRATAGAALSERFVRPPLDAGTIPLHLADRSRDCEVPVEAFLAAVDPARLRLRRIDDLFDTLDACSLIGIADGPFNIEIVEGALVLIGRTRPLILADFAGLETGERLLQAERLVAMLGAFGYAVFDNDLLPVASAEQRRLTVEFGHSGVFLLVPDEKVARAVGFEPVPGAGRSAPLQQRLLGAADRFRAARRRAPGKPGIVPCDGELQARGLYPAETNGTDWWRWSGPGRIVRVLLPVASPGPCELVMNIINYRDCALSDIAIRIDGRPALSRVVVEERHYAKLVATATIPMRDFRGRIEVEIRHGPTERPDWSSGRRIGLCFGGFVIRSGDGPG